MCQIFAGQDPENYRNVTRSVRLGGFSTSVRLENRFWQLLDLIAAEQDMTTPQFLSTVYDEALHINGEICNFASLLRCACTLYLERHDTVMASVKAEQAHRIA